MPKAISEPRTVHSNMFDLPHDVWATGFRKVRPKNKGYREEWTQWRSTLMKDVKQQECEPIPWLAYEAIAWMMLHFDTGDTVFEYGCGASTLFFRQLGLRVTSIEHNRQWAEKLDATHVPHIRSDRYVTFLDRQHDVVIVDGMRRIECCIHAIGFARKFLVLDNADWPEHAEVFERIPAEWTRLVFGPYHRRSPWARQDRMGVAITAIFVNPAWQRPECPAT